MGSQVISICNCGLKKEILIGGGMSTFTFECFFPCLCENCSDVVQVNLLELNPKCPECDGEDIISYDNALLIGEKGNQVVESWCVQDKIDRELILTNGNYKCPKCKNESLHFESGMLFWD
jgi:Zn finger protein HypA/HybF involved in hydrogenase expression